MPSVKKQRKGANDTMKREMLNKGALHTLDLTKIDGDGSFPCPKCGAKISPEDETEDVYTIVDTKVNNDELAELIIACSTCGTHIRLIGFEQTTEDIANE